MPSTNVASGTADFPKKKTYPARGKRHSKAQKEEILEYAKTNNVETAATKFINVTDAF